MSFTAIKERPILFSPPMVRAILGGRKSQTRRVIGLEKAWHDSPAEITEWREQNGLWFGLNGWNTVANCKCPYGKPGERLWVREPWHLAAEFDAWKGSQFGPDAIDVGYSSPGDALLDAGRKRHARFMPRWAARITLEITGIRAERLHGISESDAQAEGAMVQLCSLHSEPDAMKFQHRNGFINLWETLHGEGSWSLDPWVWVVEFKRLTAI